MSIFASLLGEKTLHEEAIESEKAVRDQMPLLLHPQENVELAFGGDRKSPPQDKSYFTSHRVLLQDVRGIGGKKRKFHSVSYAALQAFSVETAHSADGAMELKLYELGKSDPISTEFSRKKVNLFAVQQFFNIKVVARQALRGAGKPVPPAIPRGDDNEKGSSFAEVAKYLSKNAKNLDPGELEKQLKTTAPVLLAGEKVEIAFPSDKVTTILTSLRVLFVDVQGVTGRNVECLTILWSSISGFSVETAGGAFEGDCEMVVFTHILGRPSLLKQEFKKGHGDVFAIQKVICDRVLGEDVSPPTDPGTGKKKGHGLKDKDDFIDKKKKHFRKSDEKEADKKAAADKKSNKGDWIEKDSRHPMDAGDIDRTFHSFPPILQGDEHCELAFKGSHTATFFTSKRLLLAIPDGRSGKRMQYLSVPWKSVLGFEVQTNETRKKSDTNTEAKVWTDMMFDPGDGGRGDAQAFMSCLQFDFNSNTIDIRVIGRYLAARCLKSTPGGRVSPGILAPSGDRDKHFEKWISKLELEKDEESMDVTELNEKLHSTEHLLLDDENVVMAFKSGDNCVAFTSSRVLVIDVEALSRKKTKFTSIPYWHIIAFSAQSSGEWNKDSQLQFYTRNLWDLKTFALDLKKGRADIGKIQKFLSVMTIGDKDAAKYLHGVRTNSAPSKAPKMSSFTAWVTSDSDKEDVKETEERLRSDITILLGDERCEKVFPTGHDIIVYTNKRVIYVDIQGVRGKTIAFYSLPLKMVTGFTVDTAGHKHADVLIDTDIPGKPSLMQDVLIKKGDVMDVHKCLTEALMKTLMDYN